MPAKYRSADWDSLVGWWTSELVGVNSAAYRSTPLRPEEASAFVRDDGVKAERCVYYLLFFIGPLFPESLDYAGCQIGGKGAGSGSGQDVHWVVDAQVEAGEGDEEGRKEGGDSQGAGQVFVEQEGRREGGGGVA